MIKAILFDADGVLINGKRFSETLEKDLGVDKEKTESFFTGKFIDCLVGKADLKKELEPHLKEWKWNGSVDEFLVYWFKSEHTINEDLITYITELKEKHVTSYIATNQEKYRTEYILDKMGFATIFKDIFSSAQLGYMKPDVHFFQSVINQLPNIDTKEILFWDDTLGHVDAAKKFGINAELYRDFKDFKKKMKIYMHI